MKEGDGGETLPFVCGRGQYLVMFLLFFFSCILRREMEIWGAGNRSRTLSRRTAGCGLPSPHQESVCVIRGRWDDQGHGRYHIENLFFPFSLFSIRVSASCSSAIL